MALAILVSEALLDCNGSGFSGSAARLSKITDHGFRPLAIAAQDSKNVERHDGP
jgi:hypothetical protein